MLGVMQDERLAAAKLTPGQGAPVLRAQRRHAANLARGVSGLSPFCYVPRRRRPREVNGGGIDA
jgi:hypothetical protein